MQRRTVLSALCATALGAGLGGHVMAAAGAAGPVIDVYKSATCGCCEMWVQHLRDNGFTVRAHDVAEPAEYRAKFGIPDALGSCHTGFVNGYALEGHVPAQDVKRLLADKPKARGLAVPGMPVGSPGMEVGERRDPYDVVLVAADGSHSVYRHVKG